MLSGPQRIAVVRSWRLVEPVGDVVTDLFYKRLFELAPRHRHRFGDDLAGQRQQLLGFLRGVVAALDWPDEEWRGAASADRDLLRVMLALGRRHARWYAVPAATLDLAADALLWSLDYVLGGAFSSDALDAWSRVYRLLSQAMKLGAFAGEPTAADEPIVSGTLDELALSDVLQALSLGREHLAIELSRRIQPQVSCGAIRLKAGRVLDAHHDGRRGRAAFLSIFRAAPGRFTVRRLPEPAAYPEPIAPVADLLLDALAFAGDVGPPRGHVIAVVRPPQSRLGHSPAFTLGAALARRGVHTLVVAAGPGDTAGAWLEDGAAIRRGTYDVLDRPDAVFELVQVVRRTRVENLSVLPATGSLMPATAASPAELARAWQVLLAAVRRRATIVVVDWPAGTRGEPDVLAACDHVVADDAVTGDALAVALCVRLGIALS